MSIAGKRCYGMDNTTRTCLRIILQAQRTLATAAGDTTGDEHRITCNKLCSFMMNPSNEDSVDYRGLMAHHPHDAKGLCDEAKVTFNRLVSHNDEEFGGQDDPFKHFQMAMAVIAALTSDLTKAQEAAAAAQAALADALARVVAAEAAAGVAAQGEASLEVVETAAQAVAN